MNYNSLFEILMSEFKVLNFNNRNYFYVLSNKIIVEKIFSFFNICLCSQHVELLSYLEIEENKEFESLESLLYKCNCNINMSNPSSSLRQSITNYIKTGNYEKYLYSYVILLEKEYLKYNNISYKNLNYVKAFKFNIVDNDSKNYFKKLNSEEKYFNKKIRDRYLNTFLKMRIEYNNLKLGKAGHEEDFKGNVFLEKEDFNGNIFSKVFKEIKGNKNRKQLKRIRLKKKKELLKIKKIVDLSDYIIDKSKNSDIENK